MKKFFLLIAYLLLNSILYSEGWIRINQLGYDIDLPKVAVLISTEKIRINKFLIIDANTEKIVFVSKKIEQTQRWGKFNSTYRLNFTEFKRKGNYYIKCGNIKSPSFRIDTGIYKGTPDFLLKYIRAQRCGYNPLLKDSCHTHDGFIIYHPTRDSQHIDVVGGWHDASDYLRYVTTSATTVFHLLFAYHLNPTTFSDFVDKNGEEIPDGIPDILNEAIWGINWLLKMNPSKDAMYHQVADDRDHMGYRLPSEDTISYGKGLESPVYFVSGLPQGLMKYKNRSNGVSSIAAKFASSFSLASIILGKYDYKFTRKLLNKAIEAYNFSKTKFGVCQTAPCKAPYFYEEENYVDDMELAAAVLALNENFSNLLNEAIEFGRQEKITPWIGKDTAKHYQWYPFVNLGHFFVAYQSDKEVQKEFISYLKQGLELIEKKSKKNPFRIGVPFIWCSNNLIANILIQFRLYYILTGDTKFSELEASHRDWLLGCNPWGTSMITGLPSWGDYPEDIHSAFNVIKKLKVDGALVDGPVYSSIYKNLIGIHLTKPDEYEKFQTDYIVYHDDNGDYSTNEPTLDGTASLLLYFSFLCK